MEFSLGATIFMFCFFLLIFLLSGIPIAFGLLGVGIIALYFLLPLMATGDAAHHSWTMLNNSALTPIVLYIFMGELVLRAEISESAFKALDEWIGRIPGGLLHSVIGFCGLFAAVSGSSVATAASVGTVAIPPMKQRGYDRKMIYGAVAAGGTLGILIPPSMSMIIYGWLSNVSIGKCFFAGIIPGILLVALYMFYIILRVRRFSGLVPISKEKKRWKDKISALPGLAPIFMLGLIILGGIYFGIYTPTEAAAIGCVVALVIIIAKRRMTWSLLNNALQGTLYTSCMIYMIIAGAGLNAYVIEYLRIPILLIEWIRDLGLSNYMVLTAVCIIYYIMGCFVEGIAMCIITIPVIQPVMVALGFDPFWFGVIMVICIEVGMITPPLGINLYVIQGIDPECNFAEIVFGTIPYVAIMTILIVTLTIYPKLATWLPSMM